jgi:hypothetical protein
MVDSHALLRNILADAANHHDPTNSFSSSSCQQVMIASVTDRRYGIAMFAGSGTVAALQHRDGQIAPAGWHAPLTIANRFEHHHWDHRHYHQAKRPRRCLSTGVEPRNKPGTVPHPPSGEK